MEQHIQAEITLFTPDEGGRRVGIFQRYRPIMVYGGAQYPCEFIFAGAKPKPGETLTIFMNFLNPGRLSGKLLPGQRFEFMEKSGQIVGFGTVTQLLGLKDIMPE